MSLRVFKLGDILYISPSIVSRGTLCWTAIEEQTNKECVIKDAWRSTSRISEADLWRVAATNNVLGCPTVEYSSNDDDEEDASWDQEKHKNVRWGLKFSPSDTRAVGSQAATHFAGTTKSSELRKRSAIPEAKLDPSSKKLKLSDNPSSRTHTFLVTSGMLGQGLLVRTGPLDALHVIKTLEALCDAIKCKIFSFCHPDSK